MNSFRKLNRLPVPTTQPTTDPTSGAVPCRSLQEDRYSLCSHIFSWKPSGHRIRQYIECSLCWFRRRGRRHNFMIRASPFPPVMPCHARRVKDDNDGLGPVSSSIRPATRCHSSRLRERESREEPAILWVVGDVTGKSSAKALFVFCCRSISLVIPSPCVSVLVQRGNLAKLSALCNYPHGMILWGSLIMFYKILTCPVHVLLSFM